jgi:hypothetical protein
MGRDAAEPADHPAEAVGGALRAERGAVLGEHEVFEVVVDGRGRTAGASFACQRPGGALVDVQATDAARLRGRALDLPAMVRDPAPSSTPRSRSRAGRRDRRRATAGRAARHVACRCPARPPTAPRAGRRASGAGSGGLPRPSTPARSPGHRPAGRGGAGRRGRPGSRPGDRCGPRRRAPCAARRGVADRRERQRPVVPSAVIEQLTVEVLDRRRPEVAERGLAQRRGD